MKLEVTFTCPKCGLWTPGNAELPDDVDPTRSLALTHQCHHCGVPLEETKSVAEWLRGNDRPTGKPLLVGEMNPYGSDPEYALVPYPDGCAGHRLCCLILGMQRKTYLDSFDRTNLCEGRWSMPAARQRATELLDGGLSGKDEEQSIILLGAKVAKAFELDFKPFTAVGEDLLILPHPSGLCRLWQEPGAIDRARNAVKAFCPQLAHLIGAAKP